MVVQPRNEPIHLMHFNLNLANLGQHLANH